MLSHYCPPPIVFTLPCLSCNSLREHSLPVGRRWPRIGFIVVQTDSPFKSCGTEEPLARQKKILLRCIFSLHAGATLLFFECELVLPQRRERGSLRRTRVKIEVNIVCRPTTLPP